MRFTLPKITTDSIGQALLRYSYLITIILIIASLSLTCWFLYRQVYQTIAQAEVLTDLKKSVPGELIDREDFNKTLTAIKQKTARPPLTSEAIGRNPFIQSTTSVPTVQSTTSLPAVTSSTKPSTTTTTLAP